jgi:hypothetical protein
MFFTVWQKGLRRPQARPPRRASFHPRLEVLEDRLVPSNAYWHDAVDGNWSDASKWDEGHVPVPGDNVYITRRGAPYTVNVDTAVNIAQFTLDSQDATLSAAGQTISTAGQTSLTHGNVLLRNAAWQGMGTLANIDVGPNATLALYGATLSGAGTLRIDIGATLGLFGSTVNTSLINDGSVIAQGDANVIVGPLTLNPLYSHVNVTGSFTIPGSLRVANGFTNYGVIELVTDFAISATLSVDSGTLINYGTIHTYQAGIGQRSCDLEAQLDNRGTVTVAAPTNLRKASANHLNSGTISVNAFGLTIDQSGTNPSFTNTGTIGITAGSSGLTNRGGAFNHNSGNLNGPGTFINAAGATLNLNNSAVQAAVNNQGLLVAVGNTALNGPLTTATGSTLLVTGGAGPNRLTVANGFSNNGAIQLTSIGFADTTLTVTNGSLINMPGATIDILPNPPATGGEHRLDLELDNRGTLTVPYNPFSRCLLDTASTVHHSNSGTIRVGEPGLLVDLHAGSTFANSGTLDVESGQLTVDGDGNTGTFSWGTETTRTGPGLLSLLQTHVNLQGNVSTSPAPGAVILVGAIVDVPGTLTNSSGASLALLQGAIVNTPVFNHGELDAGNSGDRINGPLTTFPSSGIGVGGTLTVAGGFTNNGTIQLTRYDGSGPAELAVNGVLVNAAGATIESLVGAGPGMRALSATLVNHGIVTINANTTVAAGVSNDGTLTIGPGATLTVTGDYTQWSAGTLDVQLGGTPASGQFGQLVVTGTANLDGTLQIDLVNGYTPNPGDSFTIVTYAMENGDFETLNIPANGVWDPNAGTVSF